MGEQEVLRLFGTTQPPAVRRHFKSGALAFDLCEGALVDMRWHGVEIVRRIAYLLRDRDWGTVSSDVTGLEVSETLTGTTIYFLIMMRTQVGTLSAEARICFDATGHLSFEVVATPDAALETNRCGFVLLHSAALAGRDLQVEHTDGTTTATRFPREISPSQPVLSIRGLGFSPMNGIYVNCQLQAELPVDPQGKFEMEDQRNWSDASFKTYVASLLDPWPYVLPAGQPTSQRITLIIDGAPSRDLQFGDGKSRIAFDAVSDTRMPAIGVGISAGFRRATDGEVSALRGLGAQWWIVEADLGDTMLAADLAAITATRTGLAVQVQLDAIAPAELSPDSAAAQLAELCAAVGLTVEALRLLPEPYLKSFQPSGPWPELPALEDYSQAARTHFPQARIGGGMFTSFTELNRKRPTDQGLDFIGHLTTPIVHAPDDDSVMQTTEALAHIALSVKSLWPTLGYRLGPSSIAMRRNPYGDNVVINANLDRLTVADSDPRHFAQFGAAWTVAYAAAVAPFALEVLALHEAHGPRGPMRSVTDSNPAGGAVIVPAWDVLRDLAAAAGSRLIPVNGVPEKIACLLWTMDKKSGAAGLIANTRSTAQDVVWSTPVCVDGGSPVSMTTLGPLQVCRLFVPLPADVQRSTDHVKL